MKTLFNDQLATLITDQLLTNGKEKGTHLSIVNETISMDKSLGAWSSLAIKAVILNVIKQARKEERSKFQNIIDFMDEEE